MNRWIFPPREKAVIIKPWKKIWITILDTNQETEASQKVQNNQISVFTFHQFTVRDKHQFDASSIKTLGLLENVCWESTRSKHSFLQPQVNVWFTIIGVPFDGFTIIGVPFDGFAIIGVPFDGFTMIGVPFDGFTIIGVPFDGFTIMVVAFDGGLFLACEDDTQ